MILVVDNYDSFTFNLVQALMVAGAEVEVVRNDAATAEELLARRPEGILISPGPGRPEDAGVCPALVELRPRVPVLGVCLGMQVLGICFGGEVVRSSDLMHGKTSAIDHDGRGVFAGLPSTFEATRYHSLELRRHGLPEELEISASAPAGTLMGVRHRGLPYEGVQFHPESVLTREGPQLLANFVRRCEAAAEDS